MKTIVLILAHPYKKSFNHALYHHAASVLRTTGHRVIAHDLYAEGFDPVLAEAELATEEVPPTLKTYIDEMMESDGLVFIHPNWWGQPPAILKGWIDRVIRNGIAYRFGEGESGGGVPEGLLGEKTGIVFNTSNTSADREQSVFGDPLELIWKKCIFEFCGITRYYRTTYSIVADSTTEQRTLWLEGVTRVLREYFPD